MDFQQIRDFVNPAVAQATGMREVENLSMPVPVAYVPVQLVIDGALSLTSENPVQNKVIAVAIQQLDGRITAIEGQFSEGVTEAVNNWLAAHPEATTTVQDGAITYAKLDTNLKGEIDQISDLKSAIDTVDNEVFNISHFAIGANMINLETAESGKYINYANGAVTNGGSYFATDYIRVYPGKTYTMALFKGFYGSAKIPCYDASKTFINAYDPTTIITDASDTIASFIVPDGVYYVRLTVRNNYMFVLGSTYPSSFVAYDEETLFGTKNNGIITGTISSALDDGYYYTNSNLVSDSPSGASGNMLVQVFRKGLNGVYSIQRVTDSNGNVWNRYTDGTTSSEWSKGTKNNGIINGSIASCLTEGFYYTNSTLATDAPSGLTGNFMVEVMPKGLNGVLTIQRATDEHGNIYSRYTNGTSSGPWNKITTASDTGDVYKTKLYGKIWYACGDSLTHGDYSPNTHPKISGGLYDGENAVYPFYIGNRTGMVVHNTADNGATMADPQNTQGSVHFCEVYQQKIGSDAQYITLWFGANDFYQNVPIGGISDTEVTTLYGAWNTVMSWIMDNFPLAKVGIVASYAIPENYVNVAVNIAKKYGVSCLDFYHDPKVPYIISFYKEGMNATLMNELTIARRVSSTNGHPSAATQEYISTVFENWLMTL